MVVLLRLLGTPTGRITSPSLILVDGGTTRYTPLFSGSAGGTATSGNYRYTLGHLIVDGKRVALSQEQANTTFTITGSCSVDVSTGTYVYKGNRQYMKKYRFSMSISGGNDYISYVTTNLERLSASGNEYSGSWSEISTSDYPATRYCICNTNKFTYQRILYLQFLPECCIW